MKILVLNYEFPPLGGGAANATFYLLKELAKNEKLEIDLVTSSVNKFQRQKFSDNTTIHFLDIGKKGNIHYQSNLDLLKYSWKAYKYSKKLNKEKGFDLVHAFFGIPCGYVAMKLKIPYIVGLRGSDVPFYNQRFYWLDKLFFKKLSLKIWQKAKAVIANSEGLKKLALSSSPEQDIKVIYNGVDTQDFSPAKEKPAEFTLISTSRLIQRKGVTFLLQAFKRFYIKHNKGKLIFVGSGDLEQELKEKTKEFGLVDKVRFTGALDHSVLPGYLKKADVFVLPSLNEGMSNSLLEAMSAGLAIVATDTGGTKELIDKGNGIVVEKNSVSSIFQALETLYKNPEILHKFKQQSRAKAEKMSWQVAAEKYLEIYKN